MSNRKKFRAPRLVYRCRLMDDEGRLFDERLSHFSYDEKNSVYYNAKAGKFPMEFGRREPVAAIIEDDFRKKYVRPVPSLRFTANLFAKRYGD